MRVRVSRQYFGNSLLGLISLLDTLVLQSLFSFVTAILKSFSNIPIHHPLDS